MKLVYYSLTHNPHDSRERQWIQSIRSLRMYNRTIPVWLLLFNGGNDELLREAGRHNVHVRTMGDYREFLQCLHPRGDVLALYPTFHKFMTLEKLPLEDAAQLLYLDCDTFFFKDVNLLFDTHAEHDWYAREEPASMRSHCGYDPQHVDEVLLQYIARSEGLRYVPPFNSGVCLLNRGVWHDVLGTRSAYLNLVWRLLCGRELSEHEYGSHNQAISTAIRESISEADRAEALPYPSANSWIIEQIALWLSLGGLPEFSLGTLSAAQVAQGGEFESQLTPRDQCVLAHYFSGGEQDFFSSVRPIAA